MQVGRGERHAVQNGSWSTKDMSTLLCFCSIVVRFSSKHWPSPSLWSPEYSALSHNLRVMFFTISMVIVGNRSKKSPSPSCLHTHIQYTHTHAHTHTHCISSNTNTETHTHIHTGHRHEHTVNTMTHTHTYS